MHLVLTVLLCLHISSCCDVNETSVTSWQDLDSMFTCGGVVVIVVDVLLCCCCSIYVWLSSFLDVLLP
eukprot:m.116881 g.116881  ORF g.116881 m.116881 type:complete len:68 (+) comp28542_c0_seq1:1765-1968(+)